MKYTSYQEAIFEAVKNTKDNIIVSACPGSGKCLGVNTPVLMYNGEVTLVQDIRINDRLMGPDSQPREVRELATGFGHLFKITPVKGNSFICNDRHILTLINSDTGEIFDVPIMEYLINMAKNKFARAKLLRVPISFSEKVLELDPYFIGLWLGDGSIKGPILTTLDKEIIGYCRQLCQEEDIEFRITPEKRHWKIAFTNGNGRRGLSRIERKNRIWKELSYCIRNNEKIIPTEYLINSKENRLKLLAGLLDSDGYYSPAGHYEISSKYEELSSQILFLARSLGFAAYRKKKICTIKKIGFKGEYYRISISGELSQIPCLIERKKASPRRQIKDVCRTGFSVSYEGEGNFYGFELKGPDGRFLLGDFTVTHNTTTIIESCKYIRGGRTALCSFSKLIADELAERVPFGVESFTLNALGYRVVKNSINGVKFNKYKDWNILRSVVDDEEVPKLKFGVDRMIGLLKNGLVLDKEEIRRNIEEIIKFHAIEIPDKYNGGRFEEIVETCYLKSIGNKKEMSFDDQKLMVVQYNLDVNPYDVMLIDESQDLSPLDVALVEKCSQRKIFVGDEHQAIYAFRGSLTGAMKEIEEKFGCRKLPLTICFRCPENVINEAKSIYPDSIESPTAFGIENAKGTGDVRTISKDEFREMIEGSDDIVLCRTTAPLVKECLKNIIYKKCYVKGRDIGEGLERVIKNVCGGEIKNMDIGEFDYLLDAYFVDQADCLISLGRIESLSELEDKIESIKAFEERVMDVRELVGVIKDIIKDDGDGIAFMTGHKSKGLEAKRVFILRRDLIPHKKAKTDEQLEQERNLEYVMVTRSQFGLYNVKKERGE